jgi:hypothetical protein
MVNHQGALPKIRHDLQKAGLQLDTIYVERPKQFIQAIVESEQPPQPPAPLAPEPMVVQELPKSTEPPTVEIEEMPRKMAGRGKTQEAIVTYLKKRYPTNLTNHDIFQGLKANGFSTTKGSVAQTTYTIEKKGLITRVRSGVYKWNPDSTSPVKTEATKPKIATLAATGSDAEALKQAMDKVMEAVSEIETVVARLGEKLAVVEQMQKLFGGK